MPRLETSTLPHLSAHVDRPSYDRSAVRTGIVHFGPGAFHRGHQAAYVDRLLATDPRWGIAAVSMRSAGTVEAMAAQDGLYTLAILDAEPAFRVLGAHNRFLGPGDAGEVRRLLRDPAVAIVSSTVTEKGYCLGPDGSLDFGHPDIVHDLASPDTPRSLVGWLVQGLMGRREDGTAPFTPLCCDNMVANGTKLGSAVEAFARRLDPALGDWIVGEVRFPNTMVDSITPATDDTVLDRVREATGLNDAIPVSREAYTAWIIEDVLPAGAPDFASAGAVLTKDVHAYELAKLRILNGAHSSLAYIGLLMGHETVADAMNDPRLSACVRRMVKEDVAPSLPTSGGIDLDLYSDEILDRFLNPAIGHKLSQIAWDGSQKLPYRLLDTIAEAVREGRSAARLAVPVAAWMLFVERQAKAGIPIVDPLADQLAATGRASMDTRSLVEPLLAYREIFPPHLAAHDAFRSALLSAAERMRESGPAACLD